MVFVEEGVLGVDGGGVGGNYEEWLFVELIIVWDVVVVWLLVVGLEFVVKWVRGEVGFFVEMGGEGNDGVGVVGIKRKFGLEEKDVVGNDVEENVVILFM